MRKTILAAMLSLLVLMMMPSSSHTSSASAVTIVIPDQYPTIQQGIDAAAPGDTVMVRNGTYNLTAPIDFNGKAITVISENGASNCILDGQHQTRLVYFHTAEGNGSVLSGFTIRNGGNVTDGPGIYCSSASPTIHNCTISANSAATDQAYVSVHGGGIYCDASSPTISNCTISGNSLAQGYHGGAGGGGIFINGGVPIISNCIVRGNTASGYDGAFGAGIYASGSSPSITNTTVSNNSASGNQSSVGTHGGGMYFATSTPTIVNCIVSGNSAENGGGIRFDSSSIFSSLTNCTIVRNIATINGGGLYFANSALKIINSILWEDSPQEVYNETTASNPTITYSDVLGGYPGAGNINAPPLFVNLAQQDFHLRSGSPCLDVGSNAAPDLPLQDKDGNARINNFVVDMGAYEYSSAILLLNNNRFKVQVDWHIPSGITGQGTAVPLTSDSGYFWFFSGSNVELLVKILDGRGVNNHYWFFWGAMTDVQYTITVTDTETGAVKQYYGIQGVQQSGNDIKAF